MTEVGGYHLGRPLVELESPYQEAEKTFGTQRLDGAEIESADFQHCTFGNVSFKEVTFRDGAFLDCVFVGCYFRRAQLNNCRFVGCRFFECNFAHIALSSCDFRFSIFRGCQIQYSEMDYCLPTEPNLREDLARNLALESSKLGLPQETRRYRMAQIRAHEEHLVAAFQRKSQWYKDHFDGPSRVRAFIGWTLSLLNRWLWGYGERALVLVRNVVVLAFVLCPTLFYAWRVELAHNSGRTVSFSDAFYFSLENILPGGIVSDVVAIGSTTRFFAGLESLFGVVAITLFAAYIFRWSLHR